MLCSACTFWHWAALGGLCGETLVTVLGGLLGGLLEGLLERLLERPGGEKFLAGWVLAGPGIFVGQLFPKHSAAETFFLPE